MSSKAIVKKQRAIFYFEERLTTILSSKTARIQKGILYALSLPVYWITSCWHFMYDWKIRKPFVAELPVVSIGNITVGGTGKTSFTEKLIRDIDAKGVVLSRGYLAKRSSLSCIPRSAADGDEAFMLKKKLGEDRVVVGRKREQSTILGKLLGAECFVLDDGMQYRKLFRDLEVTMVDAGDPFGKGYFLPRGKLRESPKALKRSDYVVIHGAKSKEHYQEVLEQVRQFTDARCIGTNYKIVNLDEFKHEKLGVFCGLGNSEGFYSLLKEASLDIVITKTLADHEVLDRPERFVAKCKEMGAKKVLCTEKDLVKIEHVADVIPVKVSMEITYDMQNYTLLKEELAKLVQQKAK